MPIQSDVPPSARPLNAGRKQRLILSLGRQPLANNLVRHGDPGPDPLFPLDLMWCEELKLVQLSVSVPPSQLFSDYLYLTSFSPVLVEAARQHVEAQLARRKLGAGDLAMEIGSNDGYLLQHYRARGLDVLGIDPAQNVAAEAEKKGIPTRCAFFGPDLGQQLRSEGLRPKIVHANNVMAHIPDVEGVMKGIAALLHDEGVFVTETPYVRRMVESLEFDTIYHEHLFYYSLTSFAGLLERNGLKLVDVEEVEAHGGSLRITAAHPGIFAQSTAAAALLAEEEQLGMGRYEFYASFGARVPGLLANLRAMLDGLAAEGRTIAGYGAAAKATVMLNALGDSARHLLWVADRSTYKQGRLIPGIRLSVVPAERVVDDRPDYLVVFAWNYIDEIAQQLSSYREAGGQLIVPFPEPKVWG